MEGDERGRSHTTRQPTDDGAMRDDGIVQRRRRQRRQGGTGSGRSGWNASGTTWEEKDATDWYTKTLKRCLLRCLLHTPAKHNNQIVHRRMRRTMVAATDDGQRATDDG